MIPPDESLRTSHDVNELPTNLPDEAPEAPSGSLATRFDRVEQGAEGSLPQRPSERPKPARESRDSGLRFRVLKAHAEGGLGKVSVARDSELNRDVAVKEIKERFADYPESRARFVFEAEVTGQLEHPGVVPVYALGTHADGRPFYAMRFVSGNSMESAIRDLHQINDRTLFERKLRDLIGKLVNVCNTIEYAHHRGFIHRDLKPANIMLGEYGETLVVDWGLAKFFRDPDTKVSDSDKAGLTEEELDRIDSQGNSPTRQGAVVGTPQYLPPEQAIGDLKNIGPRSDVYSLGATLYHVLTGHAPFTDRPGQTVREVLARVRQGKLFSPRTMNPKVPRALDAITMAAMSVDLDKRYLSSRGLALDLENWLADDRVSVMPESLVQRTGRWLRKHRSWASAIALALIAITVVASVAFIITNRALHRTELMLACAQLEQRFDREMADEERRIDANTATIDELPLSPDKVAELTKQIESIESLRLQTQRDAMDEERRERLLQVWSTSLEQLSRRPMNVQTGQFLVSQVDRLARDFPWQSDRSSAELDRLRKLAQKRVSDWFTVPDPQLPEDSFQLVERHWQRLPCAQEHWAIMIGECPTGNLDLTVQWTPAVLQAPMVGVILNEFEDAGYRFVIADESYHPLYPKSDMVSIEQSHRLGRLWMYLVRGDTVLRRQLAPLNDELQLRLRREQGTLLTTSFCGAQMSFEDLYPLSTKQPGSFGLLCPTGVSIASVKLLNQQVEKSVGDRFEIPEIEKGDLAFAQGNFPEARAEYQKLPQDIEALFKLALTYEGEQPERYLELLRSISVKFSQEGAEDARGRKWYLYASIRLLASGFGAGDWKMRAADTLDRLRSNYTMDEVQQLIPESEKQRFSDVLLKSGQRHAIAFLNAGDTEDLRATLDLFSHDAQTHRFARWRLSDSIRFDRTIPEKDANQESSTILNELLEETEKENSPTIAVERAAIAGDLIWVYIQQKRFDEGMQLANRLLGSDLDAVAPQYLPMLVERARLHHAMNQPDAAKADCKAYLDRVRPDQPPPGQHYSHYGSACAILGIILDDAGDAEGAQRAWKQGRRRNWGPGWPKPKDVAMARGVNLIFEADNPEAQLSAWTDGYQTHEYMNVVECIFSGSGMDDVAVRRMVFNTDRIPQSWIKLVCEKTCSGPRGTDMGRSIVLHTISMREMPYEVLTVLLYQGVMHIAYDGEKTQHDHPSADEAVYQQCRSLLEHFQARRLQQKDIAFVLNGFTGGWNEATFQSIEKRLNDRTMTSGLALIIGTMMIKHKQLYEEGREVLQKYVLEREAELPYVYIEMVQEALKHIPTATPLPS